MPGPTVGRVSVADDGNRGIKGNAMAYGPIDWDELERRLIVPVKRPFFIWRKVGGLRHWRIGRFGGSIYRAHR
jgi:hypothetical protein